MLEDTVDDGGSSVVDEHREVVLDLVQAFKGVLVVAAVDAWPTESFKYEVEFL